MLTSRTFAKLLNLITMVAYLGYDPVTIYWFLGAGDGSFNCLSRAESVKSVPWQWGWGFVSSQQFSVSHNSKSRKLKVYLCDGEGYFEYDSVYYCDPFAIAYLARCVCKGNTGRIGIRTNKIQCRCVLRRNIISGRSV